MVNILKGFHVIPVLREKSRLVPLNVIPTGRPASPVNAAMEGPPIITVDAIKPVSITLAIVLKLFHLFWQLFTNLNFIKQICFNF